MAAVKTFPWNALLTGFPAVLITSAPNLRYLTGTDCDGCLLLVTRRKRILFASPLESERLAQEVRPGIRVQDLSKIPGAFAAIRRCAFEADDITIARMQRWKRNFKNTKFVQYSDRLEELRRKKTPEELARFRRAKSITKSLIALVPKLLKSGITEKQLAWKLECAARERGAQGMAFPPIVAFGSHSSRPHHHPSDRKLPKRCIVQIDIGAKFGGYCGDQSAVFFVGQPTPEQKRVLAAVTKAFRKAKSAVQAGLSVRKLDAIARDILKEEGLDKYFVHSLGHGVGLEVHERPTLSSRAPDTKLVASEIVTIEPGVYLPGKFGIRIEEEVIVPA
jgi:Xaa-Pro aminopeptidase